MGKIIKQKKEGENEEQAFNDFHDCTCHTYVMDELQKTIDDSSDLLDFKIDIDNPTKTTIEIGIAQGIVMAITNFKEDL